MNTKNAFIFFLIVLVAALRVANILPYNFTPIGAIALFGGAMFTNRGIAFLIPLSIMFISDLFIGLHDSMLAVYLGFASIALIGQSIRNNPTMISALSGSLLGSILFFLITNGAVWFGSTYYTQDITGLFNSYAAGVPFFRGTLAGDLLFTSVLFGSYKLAELKFPSLIKA